MKETGWDKRLHIKTVGNDASNADGYRYPYEPTPYCVLERLVSAGLIGENDTVLDYGCGKGRVSFFLSHRTKARSVGIEYDEHIFKEAEANKKTAVSGAKTELVLTGAEVYEVPEHVSRCYFFNPFSAEILHKVMARILGSYYEAPREILLFFYYPSDEYASYLMTVRELELLREISCADLFPAGDKRERIMVYSLPGYPSH